MILALLFVQFLMSPAMSYGKVFSTRIQAKTQQATCRLVVKNISQLAEFTDLVSEVEDARRFLELREGITEAKKKHFTFRCMCGPTYVSVFEIK